MKLTKAKLKQIIKEELQEIHSPQQAWGSGEEPPPMPSTGEEPPGVQDDPYEYVLDLVKRVKQEVIASGLKQGSIRFLIEQLNSALNPLAPDAGGRHPRDM